MSEFARLAPENQADVRYLIDTGKAALRQYGDPTLPPLTDNERLLGAALLLSEIASTRTGSTDPRDRELCAMADRAIGFAVRLHREYQAKRS